LPFFLFWNAVGVLTAIGIDPNTFGEDSNTLNPHLSLPLDRTLLSRPGSEARAGSADEQAINQRAE
jgi:hypothetical protein